LCFLGFAGDVTSHRWCRRGEKEKWLRSTHLSYCARDGTWRRCVATVPVVQKTSQQFSKIFRGYFVIFDLCNVLFDLFWIFVICNM
jgi:hypothetical protein